jgi:acyl carrier protein
MDLSPTEATIRKFLVEDVFYDRDLHDLGPNDSLLERGLLDSLAILKTVTFCEEQFGIAIPDEDVLPDHFETVRAIARLVERVRTAGGAKA